MDIGRVRAVVSQMTLKEKVRFLGCGLSLKTAACDRLKVFGLKLPEELLLYKPVLSSIGCSFDRELAKSYGELRAASARANGLLFDGAVNLGVVRDPMAEGAEAMLGEDPYAVTELARAYIEGAGTVIGTQILSGEGAFCDRYMDARALRELYLRPFELLADSLGGAVVPSGCLNGEVVSGSKQFSQAMRSAMKSGALFINEAGSVLNKSDAVNTGVSFEIGQSTDSLKAMERDVENGRILDRRVDACVERTVHFVAERYEALKQPLDKSRRFTFDERAAAVTPVLLKNDGTLPFKKDETVLVCGDIETGAHADICAKLGGSVKSSKDAAIAVVFAKPESGALSASGMRALNAAYEAGKKTVLVIVSPRPIKAGTLLNANAVLYVPEIYFSTYAVLVKILTGEISPSGKLNVSWTFSRKDYPAHLNDRAAVRGMYVWESVYNGYRYFNSFRKGVQFPFGHGLSYTNFEYSKLTVKADNDALNVEFVVKNVGNAAGETVAFVFCDLEDSPVYGLKSRLAAFARLHLEKGENTAVKLRIDYDRLAVFSAEENGFIVPGGKYNVKIAESATNIVLSAPIKIPRPSRVNAGLSKRSVPSYFAEDRLSPLGTEIEAVVGMPLMQRRNENADYLSRPPEKKKAALEKKLGKKLKKLLKPDANPDFTGMSEFGFQKLLESE